MKCYVASKYENKERVQEVIKALTRAGHTITFDWTRTNLKGIDDARACVDGVKWCDIFIGIFEEDVKYQGALVELGMALIKGKAIYILGKQLDSMIFSLLPQIEFAQDLESLIDRI